MDVYLVVFDRKSFKISSGLFDDVQNYLDEMYVEELLDEEYRGDDRDRRRMALQAPVYLGDEATPFMGASLGQAPAPRKKRSLEDLLGEIDETFSEALLRLIDAKGKTDPESVQTSKY